jgi:hypothetical protein
MLSSPLLREYTRWRPRLSWTILFSANGTGSGASEPETLIVLSSNFLSYRRGRGFGAVVDPNRILDRLILARQEARRACHLKAGR